MIPADVILLGHGSRRGSETDEGLKDAAGRLQRLAGPGVRVRMAAFEFTRPSIPEAVSALVEEGSRRIVIAPFFLFDGKHVRVEIPEELDGLRARYPDLDLRLARTLEKDPRLVDVAVERVQAVVRPSHWPSPRGRGNKGGDGVIFVNRGTRRRYDSGERLREMAIAVQERLGDGTVVEPAQAEYESPTIMEAAEALAAAGVPRVAVLPYIFFPGKVLNVNIRPAVEEARGRHPHTEFLVAPTLGVDDRVVQIAWERAQEAAGG